jgi:hypothetical protein
LRKIGHKEGIIEEILDGLNFFSIDINEIRNTLKCKEGNTYRKDDFIDIETSLSKKTIPHVGEVIEYLEVGMEHFIERVCEEIRILEVGQDR